jgi:hypothetical protein
MSKWELLKSAISGKCDTNKCRDVSIHRFTGFEVIKKEKIIWKGFELHYDNDCNDNGCSSSPTTVSTAVPSSEPIFIPTTELTITPTTTAVSSSSDYSTAKHSYYSNSNNYGYTNDYCSTSNDRTNNGSYSEINKNCNLFTEKNSIDDAIATDNYRNNKLDGIDENNNKKNDNSNCNDNNHNNDTSIDSFQKFMINSYNLITDIKCAECLITIDYIGDELCTSKISENIKKGELDKLYRVIIFENKILLKNSSPLMSDDNDLNNIQNIDICNNDVDNYPNNKDSKTREELFHLKSQFYISDKSDNISTTIGQYCMYNIKQEIDIKDSKKIDFFRVYTKEKKDAQRITKDGFLSNLIHGVDNTGMNISKYT